MKRDELKYKAIRWGFSVLGYGIEIWEVLPHTCAGITHGCCVDVVAVRCRCLRSCFKKTEEWKQYHSPPLNSESHRHSEFKAAATRNKDGLGASVASGAVIIKADSAAGNILEITPRLLNTSEERYENSGRSSQPSVTSPSALGSRNQHAEGSCH